jgi:hypothetical protein
MVTLPGHVGSRSPYTMAALRGPDARDRRGEYYAACRQYIHTASFRRLPQLNQRIWRLHANGASHSAICFRLQVTPMRVRTAIRGARLAAKLPAATRTTTWQTHPGRPPIPDAERARCVVVGCGERAHARGYCRPHYLRAKSIVSARLFVGKPRAKTAT